MFRKPAPKEVQQPHGWTDGMLQEFVGKRRGLGGDLNVLIMIDELHKKVEFCRQPAVEEVSFAGSIACKQGSLLAFVTADVRFSEFPPTVYGSAAEEAVGLFGFSHCAPISRGPNTPLVHVTLLAGRPAQRALEQALSTARVFGNTYVPLWIWIASIDTVPKTAAEAIAFSVDTKLPIRSCTWHQGLHLTNAIPQDDLVDAAGAAERRAADSQRRLHQPD